MNDVTKNEVANELSDNALDTVTGGGYFYVMFENLEEGRWFDNMDDAITWGNYTGKKIVSSDYHEICEEESSNRHPTLDWLNRKR